MILFFQAEDGIRDLVRSRGLGDVYKRQDLAEGHFFLGMLLDHNGDSIQATISYNESIKLFENRILKGKSVETNKLNLATSYLLIGQTEKAVSYTHLTLPTSDLV